VGQKQEALAALARDGGDAAVVPRIVEALNVVGKSVGLEVVASEVPESELESGLRGGRRFDLLVAPIRRVRWA